MQISDNENVINEESSHFCELSSSSGEQDRTADLRVMNPAL